MTWNKKRITKKTKLAYHEAGHVVAAYLMRKKITYVTIKPEKEPLYDSFIRMGHVGYAETLNVTEYASLESEIIFNLAGGVAEEILANENRSKHKDLGSSLTDKKMANRILKHLNTDLDNPDAHKAHFDRLYKQCMNMLMQPPNWTAVKALAKELMIQETIDSRKASSIIRTAMDRYSDHEHD